MIELVSSDELISINIEGASSEVPVTCDKLHSIIKKKLNNCQNTQDTKRVYSLLSVITFPWLPSFENKHPFGPEVTRLLGGFSENQLKELQKFLSNLTEPSIKSRVADILLMQHKENKLENAIIAVKNYLLVSEMIFKNKNDVWNGFNLLHRALVISLKFKKGNICLFDDFISFIKKWLSDWEVCISTWIYLPVKLVELLLDIEDDYCLENIDKFKEQAVIFYNDEAWNDSRQYWEIVEKLYFKVNEQKLAIEARMQYAETYVSESRKRKAEGAMVEIRLLENALKVFRKISNSKFRCNEIRSMIETAQKNITNEMTEIELVCNATGIIEKIEDEIGGVSFSESVKMICDNLNLLKQETILKEIEEKKKSSLRYSIPTFTIDKEGKKQSVESNKIHVGQLAMMKINLSCSVFLEPARTIVLDEHTPSISDVNSLIKDCPIIKPGREFLYAKGIHAGFHGDWILAGHLLPPQLEESIRYLLRNNDTFITSLKTNFTEDRYTFNILFDPEKQYRSYIDKILGPDLAFELDLLLISKAGYNLRNNVLHGLYDLSMFNSAGIKRLWWCVLSLLCTSSQNNKK